MSYSVTIFIFISHIHKKQALLLRFIFLSLSHTYTLSLFLPPSPSRTITHWLCVCSLVLLLRFFSHDSLNDAHISLPLWFRWFLFWVSRASERNFEPIKKHTMEKILGLTHKSRLYFQTHVGEIYIVYHIVIVEIHLIQLPSTAEEKSIAIHDQWNNSGNNNNKWKEHWVNDDKLCVGIWRYYFLSFTCSRYRSLHCFITRILLSIKCEMMWLDVRIEMVF